MKTYELIEPTVQAGFVTAVTTVTTYTLDDGSTHSITTANPNDPAIGEAYVVAPGEPDTLIPAAIFTAKYTATPLA